MYKYLNIKKVLLLITTFLLFFSFNLNVYAADKNENQAGACVYSKPRKGSLEVRIYRDKNGNISHQYKKNGKWVTIKGKTTKIKNNKTDITKCPKIEVVDNKDGYKHIISWCPEMYQIGKTTCMSASSQLGYFDKVTNTTVDEYQKGECEYTSDLLSVKIVLDGKGNEKYEYKDGNSWKSISKNNDIKLTKPKGSIYKCPAQVAISNAGGGKISVNFQPATCSPGLGNNICYGPKGSGNFAKKDKDSKITKYSTNDDLFEDCDAGKADCSEENRCEQILGEELIAKIQEIVNIIRIMVPILLIVFGTLDFGKAIFLSDENEMKKAQSKFIKRLIIAIGFFIIPSLIQLLLNIGAKVWNIQDPSFCGIKF